MWTALLPNWKCYKYLVFHPKGEKFLEEVEKIDFFLKIIKICPSHLILRIIPLNGTSSLFIKLFFAKFLKRNRVKGYLKKFLKLSSLGVPLLRPYLIFSQSPFKAFVKKDSFYGGILFPYLEEGFLKAEDLFNESSLLLELIKFLFFLHEKGILLKDTKFNNFYFSKKEFKIFDIDGIVFLNRLPTPLERLEDLTSLAMSLEWIGFKEAGTLIFEAYQNLYKDLNKDLYLGFRNLIERKRGKRIKKLSLSCKFLIIKM